MLESLMPLHPKLVHFPVALFVTALALEALSYFFKKETLHQSAVIVYVLAALTAPLTAWAGHLEEERLNLHHPLMERHETVALLTTWISLVSLPLLGLIQKKWRRYFRAVFFVFLLITAGLVVITAHWGGQMVYVYGVGVDL